MREDLSKVRSDIDNLHHIISSTKNHLSTNGKPLLDIFEDFKSKNDVAEQSKGSSQYPSRLARDLEETKNAMTDIEKTVNSFTKQVSLPIGKVTLYNCKEYNKYKILFFSIMAVWTTTLQFKIPKEFSQQQSKDL